MFKQYYTYFHTLSIHMYFHKTITTLLEISSQMDPKSHTLNFDALEGWSGKFYICRTRVSKTWVIFFILKISKTRKKNDEEERMRRRRGRGRRRRRDPYPWQNREITYKIKPTHLLISVNSPAKPNPPAKLFLLSSFFSMFSRSIIFLHQNKIQVLKTWVPHVQKIHINLC